MKYVILDEKQKIVREVYLEEYKVEDVLRNYPIGYTVKESK